MAPPTRGSPIRAIRRYRSTKVMASQTSCGTKVDTSSCGIARALLLGSEHEEDQEGDGEAEEAGRFGQREAEKREGLHLALRGRVAGDRVYQRREHIADADTGSDESNAGKAGPDHFGGSKIHFDFPLVEG